MAIPRGRVCDGYYKTNVVCCCSALNQYGSRIGSDASRITNSMAAYDLAGRITRSTNALGGVTIYTNLFDGSGQLMTTNTAPDGGTTTNYHYMDGSLQKTIGTADWI